MSRKLPDHLSCLWKTVCTFDPVAQYHATTKLQMSAESVKRCVMFSPELKETVDAFLAFCMRVIDCPDCDQESVLEMSELIIQARLLFAKINPVAIFRFTEDLDEFWKKLVDDPTLTHFLDCLETLQTSVMSKGYTLLK